MERLRGLLKSDFTCQVIFKHDAGRVLQSCVKFGTAEQRQRLFEQFKGDFVALIKSKYSKFFVKKMLKYGTKEQRDRITKSFYGEVRRFVRHKDRKSLIKSFKTYYAKICKEEFGHLVLLALLDSVDDTVLVKKIVFSGVFGGGEFTDLEDLIKVVTSIIFISSVGHSAANFAQYDEYAFPPNYPAFLRGKPPTSKRRNELSLLMIQHIPTSALVSPPCPLVFPSPGVPAADDIVAMVCDDVICSIIIMDFDIDVDSRGGVMELDVDCDIDVVSDIAGIDIVDIETSIDCVIESDIAGIDIVEIETSIDCVIESDIAGIDVRDIETSIDCVVEFDSDWDMSSDDNVGNMWTTDCDIDMDSVVDDFGVDTAELDVADDVDVDMDVDNVDNDMGDGVVVIDIEVEMDDITVGIVDIESDDDIEESITNKNEEQKEKLRSAFKNPNSYERIYVSFQNCSHILKIILLFEKLCFFFFSQSAEFSSLDKVLESQPERKAGILKHMKETLLPLLEKSVIGHSIVHKVLLEYFTYADDNSKREMVDIVKDSAVLILHTHDGARVAMQCFWLGTAKDRKSLIKSFKTYYAKICKEEFGHLVLLALLDSVDDTVLVKKIVFSEIQSNLKELALDTYGRKVLIYLLCPRSPAYFHPTIVDLLKKGDENTSRYSKELSLLSIDFYCCFDHVIKSAAGHFAIKRLIIQDKERAMAESKVLFSNVLLEYIDPGKLFEWCKVNRGAFVVASLLESSVPGVSKTVRNRLLPRVAKLKKYDSKGVAVVLKLLSS
ncbi:PREDICTED: pumilio homolog 3-like [Acropora digitifera]|uniref:pumilio homolog 3-like n=1 Tax=Acropora digitifera TaxID=70779 RepID=UPI00077A3226|nr:PREDICTED: pumilio homolog 3-like [Acropora digitifera]